MRRFLLLALLLTLSVHAFSQTTAVPSLMNFQGRLSKPDGTPVPDGAYSIRFSLWSALSSGAEKWSQTINPTFVRNGTFAAMLSGFPAGAFNNNLWLEIKIGNDAALTPRQQLLSVAYAFKASSVADGSVTASSIANGTITADKFAPGAFDTLSWLLGGNSGTNPSIQFIGTTDNQPFNIRTFNQERMHITPDGRVGIGVTQLTASKFTIAADAQDSLQLLIQGSTNPANQLAIGYQTSGNYGVIQAVTVNATVRPLTLNPYGGNVGIGTTSPTNPLSVSGNADFTGNLSVSGNADFTGNVGIGAATPLANRLLIQRTLGGNDPSVLQHNLQVQIDNGIGARSLGIGVLDNGQGVIQAKEVNVGYNSLLLNPVAGNVGIGTTSPTNNLTVGGNADFTGNVGIGTATPVTRLEVASFSGTDTSKAIQFSWLGSGGSTFDIVRNSTANNQHTRTFQINGGNDFDSFPSFSLGMVTNDALRFVTNDRERIRITPDGLVGIGAAVPRSALEIAGDLRLSGQRSRIFARGDTDVQVGGLSMYPFADGADLILTPIDANGFDRANSTIRLGGSGLYNNSIVNLEVTGDLQVRGGVVFPDGTRQTTAVTSAGGGSSSNTQMDFNSGLGASPTGSMHFLSVTINVHIAAGQNVHVTASKAFGNIYEMVDPDNPDLDIYEGEGLNLFIAYRRVGSAAAPTPVGTGIHGIHQYESRAIQSLSAVLKSLPPGDYEVGMAGYAEDNQNGRTWNDNSDSQVTIIISS